MSHNLLLFLFGIALITAGAAVIIYVLGTALSHGNGG